jgi:cyclophilin family peptidyl-prolyl cis-trans isomerase
MKKTLLSLILALTCSLALAADKVPAHPHILVETTEGNFKLELDGRAAPLTVANFLKLVDSGFYDGTVFHRLIPGFMAQGGGYTPGFKLKETSDTVPNESGNGLQNLRGTIAMARTGDPHSAGSQFFINVADNVTSNPDTSNLDPVKHTTQGRWGYAVFGFVFEGMDVVDKIVSAKTLNNGPGGAPAPIVPIVVKKMSRITYE